MMAAGLRNAIQYSIIAKDGTIIKTDPSHRELSIFLELFLESIQTKGVPRRYNLEIIRVRIHRDKE